MAPDPYTTAVAKALAAHRRAKEREDQARATLHREIIAALDAGVTQAELTRITGYHREYLRQLRRASEQP